MSLNLSLMKFLLILALIDQSIQAPSSSTRGSSSINVENRSSPPKLVEFKLPVKITSMHDLVAWARNAMKSMASRIDITLESVNEPVGNLKNREIPRESKKDTRSKQREISKERDENLLIESRRPMAPSSIISTYASLLDPENYEDSLIKGQNEAFHDGLSHGNLNAYLPLFFDDLEISKYREDALKKYYLDNEQIKREQIKKETREKNVNKYSTKSQQNSQTRVNNNNNETKNSKIANDKDEKKLNPVISVPFEAIVTITRENLDKSSRNNIFETRDPPDEFPPYFERDYPRREVNENVESDSKSKDTSQKRQIATLGDLLRMLGLTKKFTKNKESKADATKSQSKKSRPRKPAEKFTPPPLIQFEDQPPRQRRNETSQRQEFDDEEEEEEEDMGSLGSITDLIPLVIPILEDISDPNTETDLGEVLEAALPLIQGLSEPSDDPDAPDVLGMIGPILTKIIGGKDGQGSDVAAVLGPAISLVAPLIGPVLGPLVGPLLSTISNPPQGEGSSLVTLISAVLGPLTQTTGHGKMSPLSVLVAGIIAALSKELRPGLPGGLDVGAIISSVLSGVIAGTSAGLSGSLSSDKQQPYGGYGPYGAGPIQAGSVNTGTSTGFTFPGPQANSQIRPGNQQPIEANIVENQRIVHHTTRRPYSTLPQRVTTGPQPRPPPPTYVQPQLTGPLPAAATNAGNGDSSYLPYGTSNAVPANSVNPIGLIANLIKDILGAGIQVGSSVVNAVFGIIGSSSSDEPKPVYGPPPPSSYGQSTGSYTRT